ncbi:hypothetical protein Bbelb_013410 [Branchiostoma belcheri]|nr:hypothetical protein Bbelb_013410 [Branchiostoma belcheri]
MLDTPGSDPASLEVVITAEKPERSRGKSVGLTAGAGQGYRWRRGREGGRVDVKKIKKSWTEQVKPVSSSRGDQTAEDVIGSGGAAETKHSRAGITHTAEIWCLRIPSETLPYRVYVPN